MTQNNSTPGRFNFGLSAAQEARAEKLHSESIVFDMLSMHAGGNLFAQFSPELQADFERAMAGARSKSEMLRRAIFWPFEMCRLGKSQLIRDWLLGSGLTCGAYDIDLVVDADSADSLSFPWERQLRRYAELPWLRQVTTVKEIRQAKSDGVLGLYANFQPMVPVLRRLEPFDGAYARGLRSFTLTYNRMDHIGVGCTERVDAGLSMFGVEVVKHCNELGVIVDVSHCGHQTTMDACRHSAKPVTANHTAAKAVYDHPRGKNDDALRAVADTGGVVGVVAVPYFLSGSPHSTIEDMLDHIDHIAGLVGWQHVAIGTDWPLQAPDSVLEATLGSNAHRGQAGWSPHLRREVTQRLIGFDDCRDLPNITRGLIRRGYSDEQIRGIIGENGLRVFAAVCG